MTEFRKLSRYEMGVLTNVYTTFRNHSPQELSDFCRSLGEWSAPNGNEAHIAIESIIDHAVRSGYRETVLAEIDRAAFAQKNNIAFDFRSPD